MRSPHEGFAQLVTHPVRVANEHGVDRPQQVDADQGCRRFVDFKWMHQRNGSIGNDKNDIQCAEYANDPWLNKKMLGVAHCRGPRQPSIKGGSRERSRLTANHFFWPNPLIKFHGGHVAGTDSGFTQTAASLVRQFGNEGGLVVTDMRVERRDQH